MNRTIATLTAVVALTLAACTSGTTTTTTDTRAGWSDEAFRDLMAYCQATGGFASCALLMILERDVDQCSVEATYAVVDRLDDLDGDERPAATAELMRDVLQPRGDCLGYDLPDDE